MAPKPPTPPALLAARSLTLQRGGRLLFDGIDVTLWPGDIVLLKGPNGVGKSSLLLTLAGVLRPESGTVASETAETLELHIVGHSAGIKSRLTLEQNLRFWRAAYGASGITVDEALERVGLTDIAELDAGVLSAGQTRRLTLARLLVSRRPVWLLDEPTASLDSRGALLVAELLAEHAKGGGAALVATHEHIPLSYRYREMALGPPT